MTLTITALPPAAPNAVLAQPDGAQITLRSGRSLAEPYHMRIVPGAVDIGPHRPANCDGRQWLAPGEALMDLPARLRRRLLDADQRTAAWTRLAFARPGEGQSGQQTGQGLWVSLARLEVSTERMRYPGSSARAQALPARAPHLFQVGDTDTSRPLGLGGHGPGYRPSVVTVMHQQDQIAQAEQEGQPRPLFDMPQEVQQAAVLTHPYPDSIWLDRPAAKLGVSYVGRSLQMDVGNRLTLYKHLGFHDDAPMPISQQVLFIVATGSQIIDKSDTPCSMAVPPATRLNYVGPAGMDIRGDLRAVVTDRLRYARQISGPSSGDSLKYSAPPAARTEPWHLDITGVPEANRTLDVELSNPQAPGQVDLFDPLLPLNAGDISWLVADCPHAAVLTVKPGQTIALSQVFEELGRARLAFDHVVLAAGRPDPRVSEAPVYDVARNAA
jgi:hypothetical protein